MSSNQNGNESGRFYYKITVRDGESDESREYDFTEAESLSLNDVSLMSDFRHLFRAGHRDIDSALKATLIVELLNSAVTALLAIGYIATGIKLNCAIQHMVIIMRTSGNLNYSIERKDIVEDEE